jgi:hypothetical protein
LYKDVNYLMAFDLDCLRPIRIPKRLTIRVLGSWQGLSAEMSVVFNYRARAHPRSLLLSTVRQIAGILPQ